MSEPVHTWSAASPSLTGRDGQDHAAAVERADVVSLIGRLLWGTPSTRLELAADLTKPAGASELLLLAATARSTESWRLRARCLEVLGLAAGDAHRELAEQILNLLWQPNSHR